MTPAKARIRLEWARACGASINLGSPSSPRPPSYVYATGLTSTNNIHMPAVTVPFGDTRSYHELSATYTGSSLTVYRNGGVMGSSSLSTSGPWTLAAIGAWYSTYYMIGEVAEVILYDRALTQAERAAVDSYLQVKYFRPCGNGICDGMENASTCPIECPLCGDGICSSDEAPWTCPADCGYYGDGVCDPVYESAPQCPDDCGYCGDGFCDFNTENSWTCPTDCNNCIQTACLPLTESVAMCPIACP
ncbi:MAG TPA: LamG-like jellyroll fold domain-containing protein [Kofleriaceae bacterium]